MFNNFSRNINIAPSDFLRKMRFIGLLDNGNPSQDVVCHHSKLAKGMIGPERLAGKMLQIITVLLFPNEVLAVATLEVKLHHALKRILEEIEVREDAVVIPFARKIEHS